MCVFVRSVRDFIFLLHSMLLNYLFFSQCFKMKFLRHSTVCSLFLLHIYIYIYIRRYTCIALLVAKRKETCSYFALTKLKEASQRRKRKTALLITAFLFFFVPFFFIFQNCETGSINSPFSCFIFSIRCFVCLKIVFLLILFDKWYYLIIFFYSGLRCTLH